MVSTIMPKADWISDQMMQMTVESDQAMQVDGSKTLEVDANLYSANGILGVVPGRMSEETNGKLIVNGSVVAADVGLLAPRGTQINFDARGTNRIQVDAEAGLKITGRYSTPMPMP
ncbi:MAG: hypothetical protein AAGG01_13200 [Planctomycetota bacterium]